LSSNDVGGMPRRKIARGVMEGRFELEIAAALELRP
jgi:hypothetical protein